MSMTVAEAVASRRSVRAFLPKPVPFAQIERVLDRARMAPSGCNYQPWEAVVLTGAPLKALQQAMIDAGPDDPAEYDYNAPGAVDRYRQRLVSLGEQMYGAMGIDRDDKAGRYDFMKANIVSFDAPVVLLAHFPKFMLGPQWSDVGMWLQTIMLLLRDEGLDSCPQEWLGSYGRTIKAHLGLPMEETMVFCGMAIGHRDPAAPVNNFPRERVPLAEQVRFIGFE